MPMQLHCITISRKNIESPLGFFPPQNLKTSLESRTVLRMFPHSFAVSFCETIRPAYRTYRGRKCLFVSLCYLVAKEFFIRMITWQEIASYQGGFLFLCLLFPFSKCNCHDRGGYFETEPVC